MNFRRDSKAEVWRGEQAACATAAPPSGQRRHYSSTVGQVNLQFAPSSYLYVFITSGWCLELFDRIRGSVKCQKIRIKIRIRIFILSLNL